MSERALFVLLAQYNESMNVKLYAAAAKLSAEQLEEDRGAFFGSLIGTLNHIVAGDTIWLQRFARYGAPCASLLPMLALPAPGGLTAIFSKDLEALSEQRRKLDAIINAFVAELSEEGLQQVLHYKNMKGVSSHKRLSALLLHFFNHQTHHRGQASTLLFQAGVDIGVTDLVMLVPDED